MKFIEKLDRLCYHEGLSERALAAQLQISPSAVSRWRSRNALPRRAVMKKLADRFQLRVEDLLDDSKDLPVSAFQNDLAEASKLASATFPLNKEAAQILFEKQVSDQTWLRQRSEFANFLRAEAKRMRQKAIDYDSQADELDPPI